LTGFGGRTGIGGGAGCGSGAKPLGPSRAATRRVLTSEPKPRQNWTIRVCLKADHLLRGDRSSFCETPITEPAREAGAESVAGEHWWIKPHRRDARKEVKDSPHKSHVGLDSQSLDLPIDVPFGSKGCRSRKLLCGQNRVVQGCAKMMLEDTMMSTKCQCEREF
jgi:hypothetical protein